MSQPEEYEELQKKEEEVEVVSSIPEPDEEPVEEDSSGSVQEQAGSPYPENPYENSSYGNPPYENSPYGNPPYENNPYGNPQGQGGNPYGNSPYGQNPYGNSSYGNPPYENNPYGNPQGQGGNPYRNSPYGQDPYGNSSYGSHSYENSPYGNPQNQGSRPYSPYAEPVKKNNTKLLIGIVAGIIFLFLIAVFALTYKAVTLFTEERERLRRDDFEEYEFHDDREKNREKRREENEIEPYDDFEYDDQYGYDDYFYGDDHDYDSDQYYMLHDDIKENLSYSVAFDQYEYDTDLEDVAIVVTYPVIKGDHVPNLDHLNELIQSEIDLFKDYYEEEYADHMGEEGSYFSALSSGYVTYMDEEKMSIAFSEYIYTNNYDYAYLYCINIDMENGVVLDNENILGIDDEFSVEFRRKSDIQNGEIMYLTAMTDQEITDYFNSPDVIVFYTPQGMEIGFNYEAGWVTVTYEEYTQYLKVF